MQTVWFILIGIFGGLVGGLFGIGGGTIFVPLLVILKRFDTHLAIGTSLAVILPTAAVALFRHAKGGQVDWQAAFWLALFGILGAWIGAGLSLKMDELLIRRLFAVLMIIVAVRLFLKN